MQRELAAAVIREGNVSRPRYVVGVDISVSKADGTATAAAVAVKYPELEPVETRIACGEPGFPYIPGLLSFREAPLTLAACRKLTVTPDLIMVDGQGIAHPRQMGLACHLGLFLDIPAIGCAKSRLCGRHEAPDSEMGSYTDVYDGGEIIGAALRTKRGVKPVYVSIGHRIDRATAVHWVLNCCRGYRLPEPTRLAHLAAGNQKITPQRLAY
ncbi:deoxyribonuclease V [Chloroflexota bacterium]